MGYKNSNSNIQQIRFSRLLSYENYDVIFLKLEKPAPAKYQPIKLADLNFINKLDENTQLFRIGTGDRIFKCGDTLNCYSLLTTNQLYKLEVRLHSFYGNDKSDEDNNIDDILNIDKKLPRSKACYIVAQNQHLRNIQYKDCMTLKYHFLDPTFDTSSLRDSGSPLIATINVETRLIGIVSSDLYINVARTYKTASIGLNIYRPTSNRQQPTSSLAPRLYQPSLPRFATQHRSISSNVNKKLPI